MERSAGPLRNQVAMARLHGRAVFGVAVSLCLAGRLAAAQGDASAGAALEQISGALASVVQLLERDEFEEAIERFETTVDTPLGAYIDRLNADDDPDAARQLERDKAELTRVRIYLFYARALPAQQGKAERGRVLALGLQLAEEFVEGRFTFPVMQYSAQLQKGLFLYELGRHDDAADELSVLYGEPPFNRPAPELARELKDIRLQALLFGARSMNLEKDYQQAIATLERYFLTRQDNDPFDVSTAEDDTTLRKYAVQVRLAYAVALAGDGKTQKAFAVVDEVIAKYSSGDVPEGAAFVTDARQALGEIAGLQNTSLRARDYYQAALGMKSELRLSPGDDRLGAEYVRKADQALRTFQKALALLLPGEVPEVAPLCLSEIGEVSYLLGRYTESALAYQEICTYFPTSELLEKAATNYLAAATKAVSTLKGGAQHAAITAMRDDALRISDAHGSSLRTYEAFMSQGALLEKEGRFEEARAEYLKVPREDKGEKVPFYYRAQANAWACVHRLAQKDQETWAAELGVAIAELGKIVPAAVAEKDISGAATAALTLGVIHYERREWEKTVDALRPFTADLAEHEGYRCAGWGYLALAWVQQGKCEQAESLIKRFKPCQDDPVLSVVAFQLSECFRIADDAKKAAFYMLLYTKLETSQEDLQTLDAVLHAAEVLLGGGQRFTKPAAALIDKAKRIGGRDSELKRTLVYLDAKAQQGKGEWDQAIGTLESYVETYGARGDHEEDPYVFFDLARCHRKRSGKLSVKNAEQVDRYLGQACGLLDARRRVDATLDRLFWTWALSWMQVKRFLGDRGQVDAYSDVLLFIQERKHLEMGGKRDDFLKLEAAALEAREG